MFLRKSILHNYHYTRMTSYNLGCKVHLDTNDVIYVSMCNNCIYSTGVCGDILLSERDFDQFDVWWNIYALAALGSLFMLLSLISLYYVTRRK